MGSSKLSFAFAAVAVLGLLSCNREEFLFIADEPRSPIVVMENLPSPSPSPRPSPSPSPTEPPGPKPCRCEPGFDVSQDGTHCWRESSSPPLPQSFTRPIMIGDSHVSYYTGYMVYASSIGNSRWPFSAFKNPMDYNRFVVDASGNVLASGFTAPSPYWLDRVNGWDRISIKGPETNFWLTKTFCVDIPVAKDYVMHIGGDNDWAIKIDGRDYAYCAGFECFINGLFIAERLSSGKHLIEIKYNDYGVAGALWFEMFNNSLDQVRYATDDRQLNTLYTTKSLVGGSWDYEGEICPDGYVYDVCQAERKCTKLERQACL